MTNSNKLNSSSRIIPFLATIIFLCYANTFNVPWQLDDPPNITANYLLHITDLYPSTLWQTFFAYPFAEGKLYRPIANLSFALNWYFGQADPFGYHLVNLFVHFITTFFIFKCIWLLLSSFKRDTFTEKDAYAIALLSTILWAIHPIQTQAVTYIVQRMASFAAMFFILAIYSYIRARQTDKVQQCIIHTFLCSISFMLALGCKENAVTLIPSLLLVEVLFFYKKNRISNIFFVGLVIANLFFFLAALYYAFDQNYFQNFFGSVGSRPFSIYERLLTQPVILLFYLSLLLFPNPARLSIDHSIPLANSLFHPWTTLAAILFITALLLLAILRYRKNPLLSFAILFFFVNHLIESTIIPLELIFEHRNYLPSFFLFLPISAGIWHALKVYARTRRIIYFTLLTAIPFILIVIGFGTYSRNAVWATEESLWSDALTKAPYNARPYAKLGEIYGWQKEKTPENLQISVALLHKALDRESPRISFKAAIVGNIGKVYRNYGLLDLAIEYFNKSLQLNPDFITSRYDFAESLVLQGKFSQALEQINIAIIQNDQQSRFFNLRTLILLWLDRPKDAAVSSYQAMHKTFVNKERYFYNTGVALSRAGHHSQGEWFLKRAIQHFPNDTRILCSLIENRLLNDDTIGVQKYTLQLLNLQGIVSFHHNLESLKTDYSAVPVDIDLIMPIITETAERTVAKMRTHVPIHNHEFDK